MKTKRRRHRKGKTNYKRRIGLLKSGSPRIIFRKTNRYVIAQYIESKEAQDKVIVGITSKKLSQFGWSEKFNGGLKSLPASYLTGFLIGKEIQKEKLKTPIADSGMIRIIYGNRFFAFLKGLKDSGLGIKIDEKAIPSEDRIKGKHLKEDFSNEFDKIKSNIENKVK